MNPLLLLYLFGFFDEDKRDLLMEDLQMPPMTSRDVVQIVLTGLGLGFGICAVSWYIVSGRIGLGPYLTF